MAVLNLMPLGLLNDFEPRVTKAIRIMESSLDEPIAVTSVAKRLNISSRRLENLFQLHLQTTPGAYYLNLDYFVQESMSQIHFYQCKKSL